MSTPSLFIPWCQQSNVLLGGLWFGTAKPELTTFMGSLAEELKELAEVGK